MFMKGSRYEKSAIFSSSLDQKIPFAGVRARDIGDATGVIEHEIKEGDRLDHLARNYYNNDRLWWRILDANPHISYGADLILYKKYSGQVLLIPRESE